MSELREAAERAARQMMGLFSGEIAGVRGDDFLDAVKLIESEFAPLLAAKDAEIERQAIRIAELTTIANSRICASCLEPHPIGTMCPPHEVRTTGAEWFRERLREKDARIAELELDCNAVRVHNAELERFRLGIVHALGDEWVPGTYVGDVLMSLRDEAERADSLRKRCRELERQNAVTTAIGWQCQQCGKVNAPFKSQCDCFPPSGSSNSTQTIVT